MGATVGVGAGAMTVVAGSGVGTVVVGTAVVTLVGNVVDGMVDAEGGLLGVEKTAALATPITDVTAMVTPHTTREPSRRPADDVS